MVNSLSLYYENNESKKITKAYMQNNPLLLVYKGSDLVWSFKENFASMKLVKDSSSSYFKEGTSIRFYDLRNHGLTPEIKKYMDITNHHKRCKNVYQNVYNLTDSDKEVGIYSTTNDFRFDDDADHTKRPVFGYYPFSRKLSINTEAIPFTRFVKNADSPSLVDRVDTNMDYSMFNKMFYNCYNMQGCFENLQSIKGTAVCGYKTEDFSYCFKGCSNLSNAVCGPSVKNMHETYEYCSNLGGKAACEQNVETLYRAYAECYNLSTAACGANVTNMYEAYQKCYNLKGYAACGPKVETMYRAYDNCKNIEYANCSDAVTNLQFAYYRCYNIKTSAVGKNVIDMSYAYEDCRNLKSAYSGPNVINMFHSYIYCNSLTSAECGPKVENLALCFSNCKNLTGVAPCSDSVKNMYRSFSYCYNITGFAVSKNAVNMSRAYDSCSNLSGSVYVPDKVSDCSIAFYGCSNISSASIDSDLIKSLYRTFYNCVNMRSCTISYDYNIVNMQGAFYNCGSLSSLSIRGNLENVKDMQSCFEGCTNLHIQAVVPPNVSDMKSAYAGCKNVYGSIVLPATINNFDHAFEDTCITSITFPIRADLSWLYSSRFISASSEIVKKRGRVTLYCPSASGLLNTIKREYNFYEKDATTGELIYTGHNNAYDLDLVIT